MAVLTVHQRRVLAAAACEVRLDDLTRQLYSTDASIYRITPAAVAFPRSVTETVAAVEAAAQAGIPVVPRGAGTGLAGGALGEGLVVELARNRVIRGLDRERRTVHVGPGVVLDQLNAFLGPHGLAFGPDVATSSRATLGGMIANGSSGAHAPVYGTTADHVIALEVVTAEGDVARIGRDLDGLGELRGAVDEVLQGVVAVVAERLPAGLVKRWPGYGLDRYLASQGDLTRLVAGSEGTLAVVTGAELAVVDLPRQRGLGVLFFDSVDAAMEATVALLPLQAAAIEHIDRLLYEQTRGQLAFVAARELLGLDDEPCEAMLLVEFFDDVDDRLRELERLGLGMRCLTLREPHLQEMVWSVRKAGLSLVTACKGPAKPTACIEDVCVRPERLPEYVAGLREILGPLGLEASFYGHAASGELHVRPKLDLHTRGDVTKLRQVADAVSDLCRRFDGSLAAEHGVGMARTEYLEAHLGPQLVDATRRVKELFDPRGLLNPGKIVDTGRYRVDGDLRQGATYELCLPSAPAAGFIERDGSFVGNLEQCNGCGGCRKVAPTMCPTFLATGDELMSTRGRANIIRATLEGRFVGGLSAGELDEALTSCLSCKACKAECPSNVDLALLKAELLHARHRAHGVPLVDRVIASADRVGRIGAALAPAANRVLGWRLTRRAMQATLGLNAERSLPRFASERFDRWFARRGRRTGERGRVLLWDDTWVRYHEPWVGRAAVRLIEAAGFEVVLESRRQCCGRPAMSRGLLDDARRMAEHNIRLLADRSEPIVFLEPSCHAMFVDDYLQLGIDRAETVADRCQLLETFVLELLEAEPQALSFTGERHHAAIHTHCHAKALTDASIVTRLVDLVPPIDATVIDSGCCGMAGAFGLLVEHDELSRAVAEPLVEAVRALPDGTHVIASGASCRHQIDDLTGRRPLHLAELLAKVVVSRGRTNQD